MLFFTNMLAHHAIIFSQSKDTFDDPKVETIAELFRRRIGGALGIVSTAFIADATPGLCNQLWSTST